MMKAFDGSGHVVSAVLHTEHGTAQYGEKLLFGLPAGGPLLRIFNLPDDALRVRLRLRNSSYGQAFVRVAAGVRRFHLRCVDGGFELCHEQGANVTFRL